MTYPKRTVALAEALHKATHNHSGLPMEADRSCGPNARDHDFAAATLASLDAAGWTLLPDSEYGWLLSSNERLRRIEEAARAYLSRPSSPALLAALRAALEEKP